METPPSPKLTAAVVAGAAVTIIVWALGYFAGIDLPPEVATALAVLGSAGGVWFKRDPLRDAGQAATQGAESVKPPLPAVEGDPDAAAAEEWPPALPNGP